MTTTSRRTVLGMAGVTAAAVAVAGTGVLASTGVLEGTAEAADALQGVGEPTFTTLKPFLDPLRVPPTLHPGSQGITNVDLRESPVRLHSQMPPTRLWTYGGHFPGPTIEVRSGEQVRIAWNNKLTGRTPVKAVWVPAEGPGLGLLPYNRPGSDGGTTRPEVDRLTAWTAVHVHGGHQNALNDGAAEYGVTAGHSQLAEYANDQAAAHLFYHDHAMAVTSLNVQSGLIGNYVVRDAEEDRLGLPGGRYEIPLTIQDVNFDTDAQGRLTGQILAKRVLGPGTMPMPGTIPPSMTSLGPFTMVNGVVWPHLDVETRAYRFRLVNVSVTRAYRLTVVDEETGKPVRSAMKLIGTDLGLLDKPQTVDEALSLSPAERADVIVDFSAFPGRRLKLVNVPSAALPASLIPYPDVMQFRVEKQRRTPYRLPTTLSRSFRRLGLADVPKDATERFVVLGFDKSGAMAQIWEMQEVPADTAPGRGVVTVDMPSGRRTLRRAGVTFGDTTTFFAASGTWEKWHFISAAPTGAPIYHPMHIHLMNFQVIDRRTVDTSGVNFSTVQTKRPITVGMPIPVAPEESGWKDTITVNANTLVTVAGRLADQTGKVMYHCHLLDHEDEGMMRPFVIMPPAVHDIHHMLIEMGRGAHEKDGESMHHMPTV
ncbi:multicopper oxidase family protein [Streptomyces sp. NPDC002159]